MSITFKSRATGKLIMLDAVARRVLEILGKDPEARTGILTAEQIPAAIAALQAAIRTDEERRAQSTREAGAAGDADPDATLRAEDVTLRQRTRPFIDMLERSLAERHEVVWGV